MRAMKTCLAPLFLFLLCPHPQRIPAFNCGSMDWTMQTESKGEASEIGLALDADGNADVVYALSDFLIARFVFCILERHATALLSTNNSCALNLLFDKCCGV